MLLTNRKIHKVYLITYPIPTKLWKSHNITVSLRPNNTLSCFPLHYKFVFCFLGWTLQRDSKPDWPRSYPQFQHRWLSQRTNRKSQWSKSKREVGCNKSSQKQQSYWPWPNHSRAAEMWRRYCGSWVNKYHDKCWQTEAVPDEWQKGIIIKMPKKENLTKCGNWRGITLLSVPRKVFCVVLLGRLSTAVDW